MLFALCAAFCNAFNLVAQHRASTTRAAKLRLSRLALYLLTNPPWLLGGAALVAAFVFQALALHGGQLSEVQALLVTELVLPLALRRAWIGQAISGAAWASAAVTCVSLGVFVAMAEPRGGHPTPTSAAWASALLTFGIFAAVLALSSRRGSPTRRAALCATAAAIVWALEASILGIWLFGEHFKHEPARIVLGGVAFLLMAVGIVLISRTAPPDLDPQPTAAGAGAT